MDRSYFIAFLVVLLRCYFIIAFPFAYGGSLQDGNIMVTESCDCDTAAIMLPKRTEPNAGFFYEKYTPDLGRYLQSIAKRDRLRFLLRLPESCNVSRSRETATRGVYTFVNKSIKEGCTEVWLKLKHHLHCISFWMKCGQRPVCVGIDLTGNDVVHSTKRRLLMVTPSEKEKQTVYRPYGILMSGFILCSMVILLALCGSSPRKYVLGKFGSSTGVVYSSKEDSIEILSSKRIKSLGPQVVSVASSEKDERQNDAEKEKIKEAVAKIDEFVAENSSGKSKQGTDAAYDLVSVDLTDNSTDKEVVKDAMDGQVCTKERMPEKEIKKSKVQKGRKSKEEERRKSEKEERKKSKEEERRKSKEEEKSKIEAEMKKNKENVTRRSKKEEKMKETGKEKDLRPASPETEPKGFSKKLRLSLKAPSAEMESKKFTKEKKKKSKKNSQSEDLTHTSSLVGIPKFARDRRSFVNRELPARPQESREVVPASDDYYAEPYDRKVHPGLVTVHNAEGDGDYEEVENRAPRGTVVSAKNEVRRSLRKASGPRTPGRAVPYDANDDNTFYDSVDDKRGRGTSDLLGHKEKCGHSGTYGESTRRTFSEPDPSSQDLYETVDTRNALRVYEEPKLKRQRSASDMCINTSRSREEDERKAFSLERGLGVAPLPPSLEDLKAVVESNDDSNYPEEVIEPYTVTSKKGDFILQEVSTSSLRFPQKELPPSPQLSPDELELMYAKVDKEKQKKDRREMEGEDNKARKEKCEKEYEACSTTETNGMNSTLSKTGITPKHEHEYDDIPDLKQSLPAKQEEVDDSQLYDEVILNRSLPSK